VATTFFARSGTNVLRVLVGGFFLAWVVSAIYGALPVKKGGHVKWRPIDGAAAAAAAERKPILYDFSATWCQPCQEMERQLFANKAAAAFINGNYVPVRVDDEDKGPLPDDLRERYAVASLPTLLVIGPSSTGEPRRHEGFGSRDETLAFLRKALQQ
jgi:thiol:disulfide interchange protein